MSNTPIIDDLLKYLDKRNIPYGKNTDKSGIYPARKKSYDLNKRESALKRMEREGGRVYGTAKQCNRVEEG